MWRTSRISVRWFDRRYWLKDESLGRRAVTRVSENGMKLALFVLLSLLWAQFAAAQTLPRFQHVVVIVQENRTPD
jgi:phospholipase C